MTTTRIVKIGPGESLNLLVESATVVEGQYGPQVQFDGQNFENENVTVYIGADTANRQLERIGATVESIVGATIKIEKVQKNGKTYTNINRLGGNGAAPKTAPKVATPDAVPDWLRDQEENEAAFAHTAKAASHAQIATEKLAEITKSYRAVFNSALGIAEEAAKRVPVTLEGVNAIAATIWITAKDKGLV